MVAHVDDGRADPGADAPLSAIEDGVHHARRLGRGLDAVEALAGVAQAVGHVLAKKVRFRQRPQVEHVCALYVVSEAPTTAMTEKTYHEGSRAIESSSAAHTRTASGGHA